MLAKWTEILPVFVVRWLAKKHCERVTYGVGITGRTFFIARPDILIKDM